jgi:hypothetical protein
MSWGGARPHESHPSEPFKVAQTATWQLFPEGHDHSGANPQIVLPVVETIRPSAHKILGLEGPNRDVPGHFEINPSARRHGKIIFGSGFANPIGCANSSEERLSEGRNSAAPEIHPGPKKDR